jgi:hypothetical protein
MDAEASDLEVDHSDPPSFNLPPNMSVSQTNMINASSSSITPVKSSDKSSSDKSNTSPKPRAFSLPRSFNNPVTDRSPRRNTTGGSRSRDGRYLFPLLSSLLSVSRLFLTPSISLPSGSRERKRDPLSSTETLSFQQSGGDTDSLLDQNTVFDPNDGYRSDSEGLPPFFFPRLLWFSFLQLN